MVARPRWKEEKDHNLALRNRNKSPQKEGPLWPSLGHSGAHTMHSMSTLESCTQSCTNSAPKTSWAARMESVTLQKLGEIQGSHQEDVGVYSKACRQFKCSDSGRFRCPQPALFLDPTLYGKEDPQSSNPEPEEALLQEEALHLPQVKTSNLKHSFSIKYLISLKVINIYRVL